MKAFGFNVININGHDFDEIEAACEAAKACKGKPTAVVMKTTKGKGDVYKRQRLCFCRFQLQSGTIRFYGTPGIERAG